MATFPIARKRFNYQWLPKMFEIRSLLTHRANNCFWLLDLLLLIAGIRSELTSHWPAECLIRYFANCLFICQYIAGILRLIHALDHEEDGSFLIVCEILIVISLSFACMKVFAINCLRGSLHTLRNFIIGTRVNSGDESFDEFQQLKFFRSARFMMLIVFGLIASDTVLFMIPNRYADVILGLPPQLYMIGKPASSVVNFLLVTFSALGFFPKYLSNVTYIGILLIGMHSKLTSLVHRYRLMLNHPVSSPNQYFEWMSCEVEMVSIQQLEYWNHLRILKNIIGKTFFFVHYFAIFSIGTSGYAIHNVGFNTLSAISLASTLIFLLEYYLLCLWIDKLQDVADSLGSTISELCTKMPYSREYHSKYFGLRASLMITWINTQHAFSMDCMGLFKISTSSFTSLIDTAYTMLMFLTNVCKTEQ
ncbi:uncharacterized protein LOC23687403 [Aedes aegypti]|uniref:Uncharacterized protein n=3 Tax=Aedes aegypti TaxID=7159 RepID=A0A1S4G4Z7_AEDAE|nr:odorant receptor 110 [Aedes aegypti]